jgi:hypothetical protein
MYQVSEFKPAFSFDQYRRAFESSVSYLKSQLSRVYVPSEPVIVVVHRQSSPIIGRMGDLKGKRIQKANVVILSACVQQKPTWGDGGPDYIHHVAAQWTWKKDADNATFENHWHEVEYLNRIERRSNELIRIPVEVAGYLVNPCKSSMPADVRERCQSWLTDLHRFLLIADCSQVNNSRAAAIA